MGSDALPSWTEAQSSTMSTEAPSFLKLTPVHRKREEKEINLLK